MTELISWVTLHGVELVAILWTTEKLLTLVAELTPWKWDDNLAKIVANVVKSVFPKKQ